MLQRLKQRVTKLETATDTLEPDQPQKPFTEQVDDAIALLPLHAWDWVLQLTKLRSSIDLPSTSSMEQVEVYGEMFAGWNALTYGLELRLGPSPRGQYWIVRDLDKAIPYLLRCSYREMAVLTPEARQELIEQGVRLVRAKCQELGMHPEWAELVPLAASLEALKLPRLFDPFLKRYTLELERQNQGVTLPDLNETDTLEHKRLALGRWFGQQCGTRRRN